MKTPTISSVIGKLTAKNSKELLVRSHLDPTKILHNVACIDGKDDSTIDTICKTANYGFVEWSARSVQQRAEILGKAAEILSERKRSFVDAHLEIGGPVWFANFNVDGAIGQLKQYIACILSQQEGQVLQSNATALALTYKRPIGPVLSIAPWNAPVILGSRSIAAPLAAGCSVVLKSSEKSPLLSFLLVKCFHDAGVPSDTLQLINVTPDDSPDFTKKMLSDDAIRMVNFTGSTAVGRQIAIAAASNLKPTLLELGGKNCIIVESDADLQKCVPAILQNSWWHQGQICMSSDKVYVHSDIYKEFIESCLSLAKKEVESNQDLKIPLRDKVGSKRVNDLVKDAVSKGATIIFGDYSKEFSNNQISPLILEGVTSSMKIHSEEIFGPVFCVYRYDDINSAVDEVNSSKLGLKASVWARDTLKAIGISKKIQCGGVHINRSCVHDEPTVPHGGIKSSGQGRFNSSWGIDSFSYTQAVTVG
ncbi:potassium-activated aldehyde dehydrogenase, mitochondrial [[Candida] railenensis]|uniref:Potassium-activated aldehyde dehydrogenase, mitochondrial n=1 Tax=[Candida] railenensis TaxID=45579 RepID=A0A9P0QM54_9ASCO|nr:potassium-activated aldehyde dehydrogenase, mitochondrial [[Candida] railenensis]